MAMGVLYTGYLGEKERRVEILSFNLTTIKRHEKEMWLSLRTLGVVITVQV